MEEQKRRAIKNEILLCKRQLQQTDYKVLKYIEGKLSFQEFEQYKLERQTLRDRINTLEEELAKEE